MKALVVLLISGCLLSSCVDDDTIKNEVDRNISNRIKFKTTRVVFGTRYYVIEVDGVEYLSQYKGGITRITK